MSLCARQKLSLLPKVQSVCPYCCFKLNIITLSLFGFGDALELINVFLLLKGDVKSELRQLQSISADHFQNNHNTSYNIDTFI